MFNQTAKQVCEGQQLDMDFEKESTVKLDDYLNMIELKTSVLLAASLQMGAIIGGASAHNCTHLYQFGKQFGNCLSGTGRLSGCVWRSPEKFGKDVGGDIRQNKKTFLLLHALEVANTSQREEINYLLQTEEADKVERMLKIYRDCNVDEWAKSLKEKYMDAAMQHLEDTAVVNVSQKAVTRIGNLLNQPRFLIAK